MIQQLEKSPTINLYKQSMLQCLDLYYPNVDQRDLLAAIDYSIEKRMHNSKAVLNNSYKKKQVNTNLLAMADYVNSRHPIVTAYGTMFMHHADVPNPMGKVVQSFLDLRSHHKNQMFQFPKGSEQFEHFNLMQQLDKIDTNGIYGCIGMYSSLLYNINVASSITSQGRALVSSMTLHFEMLLANSVKFGSLDEVLEFINHVKSDRPIRKFDDRAVLDIPYVTPENCFAKIIDSCGYRWVPTEEEMDIIWRVINNLDREDITRVYYKNNLYEFLSNSRVCGLVEKILTNLREPLYDAVYIPDNVADDVNLLSDYIYEYVYYRYLFIDRIDRCDNMIKSIVMISDTDSTIISLDAWYRFFARYMDGKDAYLANDTPDPTPYKNHDDFVEAIKDLQPKTYVYDEIDADAETFKQNHPDMISANDNMRFTIINLLGHILDRTVNDYMEKVCENMHSLRKTEDGSYDRKCRILAKNEFLFRRAMMTKVKKNYATIVNLQEGHMIPESKQLDVKGIEALTKSTKPITTRKALQKILLEDILKAPVIDQLKFVKDIIKFEHQIVDSIRSGSTEYYKPATVKAMSAYKDPIRIQGVKASIAWDYMRRDDEIYLNLEERNPVNIAKVVINRSTVEKIKDKFPDQYAKILDALDHDEFKTFNKEKTKVLTNKIDAVAIPLEQALPDWLEPFIDYDSIINDNIGAFPYASIGIQTFDKKNINYTNIVNL